MQSIWGAEGAELRPESGGWRGAGRLKRRSRSVFELTSKGLEPLKVHRLRCFASVFLPI